LPWRARSARRVRRLSQYPATAVLLLLLACDGERRESDGSTLEAPRSWTGAAEESIALPADALSVTVLATGAPTDLLSLGVRDPGRLLVDPTAPEGSLNRVLRGHGLVTGALPSSTAALPLASSLAIGAVKLEDASGQPVTVTTWVKRAPGGVVPAVQELPLAVLFVGPPPPGFDVALGELGRIWRAAGIELGEPARLQVEGPAAVAVDPALGSDSPAVGAALRLSERAPPGTLALVVVRDLTLAGGELGLWALAGGIPVPPRGGTGRSGVVVGAQLLARDPIWGGQVIAHEIGHALGLYHTTERPLAGGAIHDQIDDSAECPAAADHDGDAALSAAECDDHDAANLMFWATPRGATRLTSGQAEMARRSALVR
jgi:hypothetical protein